MKQIIAGLLGLGLLLLAAQWTPVRADDPATAGPDNGGEIQSAPVPIGGFSDVTQYDYFSEAVGWAKREGLITGITKTAFCPEQPMTRGQVATLIWRYNGRKKVPDGTNPFYDVSEADYYYQAVLWGMERDVIHGTEAAVFAPEQECTCAQILTFLWRSKGYTTSAEPWYGAALSWAERYGIAEGVPDVEPDRICTRGDAVCFLYRFHLMNDAYDYSQPAPEREAVPASWFDDAVLIGDSVTERLRMYCASTGALAGAAFLSSTSLSATNALSDVSAGSIHPSYNGQKMLVEDSVAACGAKNVFLMLGINDMMNGIDFSCGNMVTLIGKILEKSPDANIIVESVTPMTRSSSRADALLNNSVILRYNQRMLELCGENGWYFVDVAYMCRDAEGYLIPEYCSDVYGMGIHFTSEGAQAWVDYLSAHVPEPLKTA